MGTYDLARLLQPPVTAQWQDIGPVSADNSTGEVLLGLQSLTKLDLHFGRHISQVDFLSQLQHLTTLHLDCHQWGDVWLIPAGALLASS